jgi:outer membrane protein assembly factor BamB
VRIKDTLAPFLRLVPRIWLLGFAGLAAVAVGIAVTALLRPTVPQPVSRVGPPGWVRFAGDQANNPVDEAASVRGFTAMWTYQAPEPLQQASIAGGRVFVSGDGTGPGDGNIYALDAATGRLLWVRHLDNMSMTTPVVGGGRVFVGSGNQFFTPLAQRADARLSSRHLVRGLGSNAIYALSARDGRVLWRVPTAGENMPTFVLNHGTVYAANGAGEVLALNARTGAVRWKVPIGSYVSMSSPVLVGHDLYVSGAHPYELYAINIRRHRVAWARPIPGVFGGSDDSSLAAAHGRLFVEGTVGTAQHPATRVFAFDAATGSVLWSTRIGSSTTLPTDIQVAAPTVVGGLVLAGSPVANRETALDAATGRVIWTFNPHAPIAESPAVARGTVYVGDESGMVFALSLRTGAVRSVVDVGGSLSADYPLIVGDTLFQPNENGAIDALPLSAWDPARVASGPNLPMPQGTATARAIQEGETLFMTGQGLDTHGASCNTCHAGGGTLASFHRGVVIPPLVGVAAGFPQIRNGRVTSLSAQVDHCLSGMHAPRLAASDPRLQALELYLEWLSSGFPEHPGQTAQPGSRGGGCG